MVETSKFKKFWIKVECFLFGHNPTIGINWGKPIEKSRTYTYCCRCYKNLDENRSTNG